MAFLKEQVARADIEKGNSNKLVAKVREKSEQRMIFSTFRITSCNRAVKLTRAFMIESAKAIDAVVQQLRYEALSLL